MATAWDIQSETGKVGPGISARETRSIVIAAASLDPLGTSPTAVLRAGTPMAPISGGKYKPVRMTLADGAYTGSNDVIPVTDTTMFAVGDVIVVIPQATPTGAASALGTIKSISAGVSVTLTTGATTAVASGDIIAVSETDDARDTVILESNVDLRNEAGTAVDTGAVGVSVGQMAFSAVRMNTAKGITLTRLEAVLNGLIDFVPATAGLVG